MLEFAQIFQKIWQPIQSSRRRTCDLKEIPKWEPTRASQYRI